MQFGLLHPPLTTIIFFYKKKDIYCFWAPYLVVLPYIFAFWAPYLVILSFWAPYSVILTYIVGFWCPYLVILSFWYIICIHALASIRCLLYEYCINTFLFIIWSVYYIVLLLLYSRGLPISHFWVTKMLHNYYSYYCCIDMINIHIIYIYHYYYYYYYTAGNTIYNISGWARCHTIIIHVIVINIAASCPPRNVPIHKHQPYIFIYFQVHIYNI